MNLEAGSILGGKYRLTFLLGEGGMGCVWAADDTQLDRRVAVKLLSGNARELAAEKRFMREARTAAQLRSPHVAQVFDFGIDQGQPYIVMEHLQGEDLERRLQRGRMAPEAVATLVDGASAALYEAHCIGIIHRDIKPANLFFAKVGDRETVKVLDFGIATRHVNSAPLTAEGTIIGTPRYMSPEQSQAQQVDLRSDLWSLSMVAYEALTGEHPFEGTTDWETLAAIVKRPIKPPSEVAVDLPPTVDEFFQRALRRNPAERFSSADHMAMSFLAAVRGESFIEDLATSDTAPVHTPQLLAQVATVRSQPNTDAVAVDEGRITKPVNKTAVVLVAAATIAGLGWLGLSGDVQPEQQAAAGLVPEHIDIAVPAQDGSPTDESSAPEAASASVQPPGESKPGSGTAPVRKRPAVAPAPRSKPPPSKGGDANEFGI